MARRGPLRACGISTIEILGKASAKRTDFNGPIGSITNMILALVSALFPLIFALQNQLLAILSFADDRILAVESIVEILFPPSKHLFNKIDKLVYVVESLPENFDEAMNKFHVFIHQVTFLDCAISWLNLLIIMLTRWGSNSTMEKEIKVDIDCNKHQCSNRENVEDSSNVHDSSQIKNKEEIVKDSSSGETVCAKTENSSNQSDSYEHEKRSKNMKLSSKVAPQRRRSYKEILELGTKESTGKATRKIPRTTRKKRPEKRKKKEDEEEDETGSNSDLLDLFDSSWHLNPSKDSSKRSMSAPILL